MNIGGVEGKPLDVLLVEDSPGDVRLTKEAFREGKVAVVLHEAYDGEQAMAFLGKEGAYHGVPTPDLILLDLNLPRMDGREVLRLIKSDEELRKIPVVVLTVSSAEKDILKAYDLNANSYITKPIDLDEFVRVVKSIENFWLTVVKLPPK